MKANSRIPRKLVKQAARLRAAGWSWKLIAEKLGRSESTCSRWLTRYPALWSKEYLRAEAALLKDAGSEARVVLQRLMRSEDEKLQCTAARMLFQARAGERKREDAPTTASKHATLPISGEPRIDEVLQSILEFMQNAGT